MTAVRPSTGGIDVTFVWQRPQADVRPWRVSGSAHSPPNSAWVIFRAAPFAPAALFAFAVAAVLAPLALLTSPARAAGVRLPIAPVGAGLVSADTPRASLLRPATVQVTFRVPPADDALYVITPSYVRALSVTIVGPGSRRRAIDATTELPGHILGLRIPPDASAADGVALEATTVSTATPPFLVSGAQIATLAWGSRWYTALFGLFCGLALLAAASAARVRSLPFGGLAALAALWAALTIPWIGLIRPDPVVSQLLHAIEESATIAVLAWFVLAYVRRPGTARAIPRWAPWIVWTLVVLGAVAVTGGDVLQDEWPLSDTVAELPEAALVIALAVLAFRAVRARVPGSAYIFAGAALTAAAVIVPDIAFAAHATNDVLQIVPLVGDGAQILLFLIGLTIAQAPATVRVPIAAPRTRPARGNAARAVSARLRAALGANVAAAATPPAAMAVSPAAILAALAEIDGLTGIANRTALDAALATAWERARRARTSLAVLIADVDLLKKYNELYGPEAGDDVLRRVAASLAQTTERTRTTITARRTTDLQRSGRQPSTTMTTHAPEPATTPHPPDDLAGRYGAEEFLVLLDGADDIEAKRVAEAALAAVSALDIAHRGAPSHRITVSIGIASLVPDAAGNGYELVRRANTALYLAKTMGRNRAVTDEPAQPV